MTDAAPAANGHAPDAGAGGWARWMRRCLDLAARGAGRVSPNPRVGAVVLGPDGAVLGEGWHRRYGGPHAEAFAIRAAEAAHGPDALRTATMVVNLEPCSHHGKTPPCADLIVRKGLRRVVVGMVDPFPAVAGRGLDRLRAHGVDVTVGVLENACRAANAAFVHHVQTGRPLVTLKTAQTLDGFVATTTGDARWVSGEAARARVHRWRAETDAVLVGAGTARADDPRLTVRHPDGDPPHAGDFPRDAEGAWPQPRRLVLDRTGALPPTLRLFADAHAARTVAVVGAGRPDPPYAEALRAAGGRLLRLPETPDADGRPHLDLGALLDALGRPGTVGERPVQSLLVEAGPGLATALWHADLVDRYRCFVAPKLLGDGLPAQRGLGITQMADARTFATHAWEPLGDDLLFRATVHPV
jgi:diaminohydroxyphosphoribosylaminopyrimidine deaminase/5-amino-6-(5-phosphoribosylamino)uracil reductase